MASFLLDTHVLIWWWDDSPKLPSHIRAIVADRSNDIAVSAANGWEIATKVRSGRLPEMEEAVSGSNFGDWVTDDGFHHLDIRHQHSVHAGLLAGTHRDPFDRLIAAQALIEDMTVLTRDAAVAAFGCKTRW